MQAIDSTTNGIAKDWRMFFFIVAYLDKKKSCQGYQNCMMFFMGGSGDAHRTRAYSYYK
jgi:hypothetical protein